MNFRTMDYFIAVARTQNITKAASELHIAQQTLSAHINALEKELECELFLRRVPLELTYAGQVFLRYAIDFQKKYHSLQQEFMDIADKQVGQLKISISPIRGRAVMPPIIEAFRESFPGISIQLMEVPNDELALKVINGEADIAIGNLDRQTPELELEKFYDEEVILLVSKELLMSIYGERTSDVTVSVSRGDLLALAECPFVLNGSDNIAGRVGRYLLRSAGLEPKISVLSVNIETLLSLCVRGIGACFCPKNLAEAILSPEQFSSLRLFSFGRDASYPIYLGYLRQPHQWSIISSFIKLSKTIITP